MDDEKMIIETTRELLENLGYRVLVASSGDACLSLYQEKKGEIQMVILDMVMPKLGGNAVFERLKEIDPHVKVLLASGYSQKGEAQKILDKGCNGFIHKPFNLTQLSRKIRKILDEH